VTIKPSTHGLTRLLISGHTRAVVSGESPEPARSEGGGGAASPAESSDLTERTSASGEIEHVSFPLSVRGYDRRAVDAYVSRVQNLLAELEATRSPEAAVKHALEQVGEQTKGVLEQAGKTAEQITGAARQEAEESTARSRQEAEEILADAQTSAAEILTRSKAEAEAAVAHAEQEAAELLQRSRDEVAALRDEAEARMRKLHADTETIEYERSQLLADIREIATRVEEVASAATARFPRAETSEQTEEEKRPSGTGGEAAATTVTRTEKPTAQTRRRSPR
jgi:DivIVA domain-containing protein